MELWKDKVDMKVRINYIDNIINEKNILISEKVLGTSIIVPYFWDYYLYFSKWSS